MRWLWDWGEAAKHPRRTTASSFVTGLVGGGLVGYWRFGGVAWGVALGVVVALVLAQQTWKIVRDPTEAQALTGRERGWTDLARSAAGVLMPFAVLAFATLVGFLAGSADVLVVVLVVGIALLPARRFIRL